MAGANYAVMLSHPLTKVLATNSTADSFAPSSTVPGTLQPSATEPSGDGVYAAGQGGSIASLGVYLVPFGEGDEGETFLIRLTGWRVLGTDPNTLVWVPMYLVTLSCQLGDLRGPATPHGGLLQPRLIRETERFCDLTGIVDGSVGDEGEVSSWGSGRLSWVFVELMGAQKWQLEFAGSNNVAMNSLFSLG